MSQVGKEGSASQTSPYTRSRGKSAASTARAARPFSHANRNEISKPRLAFWIESAARWHVARPVQIEPIVRRRSGNSARLRFEGSSSLQRGRSADGWQVLDRGLWAAAPFSTRRGGDWAASPHGALLLILDSGTGRRTLDVEGLRNGYETASRPPAL